MAFRFAPAEVRAELHCSRRLQRKQVSLSLLGKEVNKVCGPKGVSNKAEKGENFKERNVGLPAKGGRLFRLLEITLLIEFEKNEIEPYSLAAVKDTQPLANPSVILFLKY